MERLSTVAAGYHGALLSMRLANGPTYETYARLNKELREGKSTNVNIIVSMRHRRIDDIAC